MIQFPRAVRLRDKDQYDIRIAVHLRLALAEHYIPRLRYLIDLQVS